MENKSKNTHHWRRLWLFVIALALSGLLHLGWHMLGERQVNSGAGKEFEVTVCLPPFCDEPEPSGDRHMAARSTSAFPEPVDFEEQAGFPTSLSHDHQFPGQIIMPASPSVIPRIEYAYSTCSLLLATTSP